MGRELLLVDDDPLVLPMLKELFNSRGFNVVTATSAKNAVAALQNASFDLVITDMRMETPMAGLGVIKMAKSKSNQPITVILSAFPLTKVEWRRYGADAMFLKGSSTDAMLQDLEQLLRRRERRGKTSLPRRHRKIS